MNDAPPVVKTPVLAAEEPLYTTRIATTPDEIRRALELRYDVFVREMGEGMVHPLRVDCDPFDLVCKHLLVEYKDGTIIGTYRMQTGINAREHLGYYSAGEFEMEPFEPIRSKIVELGRACVHEEHRSKIVLSKLWTGIANFARENNASYLIGCSSIHSTDHTKGAALFQQLRKTHLVDAPFRTLPVASGACPVDEVFEYPPPDKLPRLFAAYMAIGVKICGPPFIDRSFGTTDFLTFFDFEHARDDVKRKYLGMK